MAVTVRVLPLLGMVVAEVAARLLLVLMEQLRLVVTAERVLLLLFQVHLLLMLVAVVVVETPHLARLVQVGLAVAVMGQARQLAQMEQRTPEVAAVEAAMRPLLIGVVAQAVQES